MWFLGRMVLSSYSSFFFKSAYNNNSFDYRTKYHKKTEYFEWEVQVVGFERLFVRENNLLASCWAPLLFKLAVWGFVMNQPPTSSSATCSWGSCWTFFLTWAVWILLVGLTLDSGTEHFWTSSIFLTWATVCRLLCNEGSEHYFFKKLKCCFSYSTNGMTLGSNSVFFCGGLYVPFWIFWIQVSVYLIEFTNSWRTFFFLPIWSFLLLH